MDKMNMAAALVEFIGKACGENYEVVLQDLREGKNRIMAISNGHISGRAVGDPLTGLSLRLVKQGVWKTGDYICNYEGKSQDNRRLRSSAYFIKEQGNLLGMLSITVDTSKFIKLSEDLLGLAGLGPSLLKDEPDGQTDNFYQSMEEIIQSVLSESGAGKTFTLEKRLTIIERLKDHGIFMLRGSVSAVAERLKCSVASMYRYIAMINKRKGHAG